MNKENMIKWAEALESGKYNQCDGALRQKEDNKYRYCCLGVAEVLAGSEFNSNNSITYFNDMGHEENEEEYLSPAGKEWLGVDEQNPDLRVPSMLYDDDMCESEYIAASILNDSYEFTFEEIAKCIRHTVENDSGS